MSSSESRAEVMKPLLIKAGIPAALSVAAYVCARIISKRSESPFESLSNGTQQNCSPPDSPRHNESFHSLNSASSDCTECEDQDTEIVQVVQEGNLEDKLIELETKLEELKNKEWELETRFLRYRNMKDKEVMLMEIKNMNLMQKARAEFLLKEISLLEDENQRVGNLVTEYIKLMNQLQGLKGENGLLRRKARKQWRRAKQRLRVIREKRKLSIEAKDAELLSNRIELEMRANYIQELENEVAKLKEAVDHLQSEKIELYNKLEVAEKLHSANQIEVEVVTKEEYDEVLKELEQLKNDHAVDAKELKYLKWSNACLRHQLAKYNEQQEHTKNEISNQIVKLDTEGIGEAENHEMHDWNETLMAHDDEHCLATGTSTVASGQVHSKRKKLIQKFKKWVDGGKIDEKDKNEMKCFGGHSVSEDAEDQFVHARKSCSSV